MTVSGMAMIAFASFAGAFALASIAHDVRAALAAYRRLMEERPDDEDQA